MRHILWAMTVAGILTGCGTTPGKAVRDDDPDIEEARNDMEDSRADYEACLRDRDDYEEMDCEPFKEMYEEDREAYDRLLKANKAKR